MKNPNGYGSIYRQKGNRRKPFVVRITVGWREDGKRISKILGTYATQKEANEVLVSYNRSPYDIDSKKLKFKEVFEKWSKLAYEKIAKNTISGYNQSFRYCEPLHDKVFSNLRTENYQELFNFLKISFGTKRQLRLLIKQLYTYGMQYDIVEKDYSKFIDVGKRSTVIEKIPFTVEEIDTLFQNIEHECVDTVLFMIYTGIRVSEMMDLKKENVNLVDGYFTVVNSKTTSGKGRIIPIHSKIMNLVIERFTKSKEYLFENENSKSKFYYTTYLAQRFTPLMKKLNMKHTPHECRHTFATLLSKVNGNSTSIKEMIGHSSYALTEKFYTHKELDDLKKELEKLT